MSSSFTVGTAPGAVPVLGHGWQLGYRPVQFLGSLPAVGDLVRIRLGLREAFVPCHPELLHQVLTDDRTYDKGGPLFERLGEMFGNGLGSCPYRDHRRQRRLVQPLFEEQQLKRYAGAMTVRAAALAGSWRDGQELDVFPALFAFSLQTIADSVFPAELDSATAAEIHRTLQTVLRGIITRMLLPRSFAGLPTPGNRRYRADLAALNRTVDALIARYAPGAHDREDMLSQLLREDGESPLTSHEVHDEVVNLMVAATEAVASTLTWALFLLSTHPVVAQRLYAEITDVTYGRAAQWADLPMLPYTDRVITETLRLYPPGWLFTRIVTRETELAGQRLADGTVVVVSPLPVNRHPAFHAEPGTFDPDRRPGRSAFAPGKTVVSFGGGARRCIGVSYAKVVTMLTLATIVGRWRLGPAEGTNPLPAPLTPNLRPRRVVLRLAGHARPG